MTLYRATIVDTPGDPFTGDPADALATDPDGGHPGAIRWAGAIVKAIG